MIYEIFVYRVFVQVMCSYITLPLYALVTQMGSTYKSAVLEDQTIHVIKQWHKEVKQKRRKLTQTPGDSPMSNIVTQLNAMDQLSRTPSPSEFTYPVAKGTDEIIEEIQEDE
ncbi:hypothetical protein HanHA300_Chr13g0483671 [Helianthus annuus]|nr:hypothetical protein HanHA300_Chr13g0483671 [Helianthus annuus]